MKKIKVNTKVIDGETWYKFNSEWDKWKYTWGNILTAMCLVLFVVLGCAVFYIVMTNVEELRTNPFIYGANRMKGEVKCDCYNFIGDQTYKFKFNNTDWVAIPKYNYQGNDFSSYVEELIDNGTFEE